jgi:hypothetical protein
MEDSELAKIKELASMMSVVCNRLSEISNQVQAIANSPKLEYAVEVANTFEGHVASLFAYRLTMIDQSRKQKYLDSKEVQDTLRAFHLDAEKFWYLCLFIKDIVEGYADGYDAISPREEITQLVALLQKAEPDKKDNSLKFTSNALLSLKLGKMSVKIDNQLTLDIIKAALYTILQTDNRMLDADLLNMKRIHKADIYKIAWFNKYLSSFLKDKVADKAVYAFKGSDISTDKSLLISRMIFVLGLSGEENFYIEYTDEKVKKDYLKGYIKKYKKVEVPAHQSRYFL